MVRRKAGGLRCHEGIPSLRSLPDVVPTLVDVTWIMPVVITTRRIANTRPTLCPQGALLKRKLR